MKFKFELERVLAHKKTIENVAHRNWAEAQALVIEGNRELERMYVQIDEARGLGAKREGAGNARGFEIAQVDEFVNGHKIRIGLHRQKLRTLMGEAERLHEILVAAARERKILEKLREKRLDEFKLDMKKRELKRVDELIVMTHKSTRIQDAS